MKTCQNPDCKQSNPQALCNFDKQKRGAGGLKSRCKECHKAYKRARYATCENTRAKAIARSEEFRKNNPEEHKIRYKAYTKKSSTKRKAYNLAKLYGITVAQKDLLAEQQGHACAICYQIKPLNVDHDHSTGIVRQLLCSACNTALGLLKENVTTVEALLAYIVKHRK